jgi:lipopolysaccharide transport system ATP-binding protein
MSDIAIRVTGLSKRYRIGLQKARYRTLRESITEKFSRIARRANEEKAYFWALKDIDFEVKKGESLGIIGRNGAGKSTLLKILSRITKPTSGRAVLNGRVGSLLEVGTGFHPELTGRENIYLNGAILGMRRTEIDRKFDEIVAFSEIEKFLDTPVKRYSSGMYVRLAFAVAAHMEPEILIVDEVLAVGDAEFQKKCLGKMGDVASEGRTVIFVSHNMTAVLSLCSEALLLKNGMIEISGLPHDVIDDYLEKDLKISKKLTWADSKNSPGNDLIKARSIEIISENDQEVIKVNTPFSIKFRYQNFQSALINLSLHIKLTTGETVFAVVSPRKQTSSGMVTQTCYIPGNFLNDGRYSATIMVIENSKSICTFMDLIFFEIQDVKREGSWFEKWPGMVRPDFNWSYTFEKVDNIND